MNKKTVILFISATAVSVPLTIITQEAINKIAPEDPSELTKISMKMAPPILGWTMGSWFVHMVGDLMDAVLH